MLAGVGVEGCDVVVHGHAAVAAPTGSVFGIVEVEARAQAHEDVGRVFPTRRGGMRDGQDGWGRGTEGQKGELGEVEEGLFRKEVEALGLHFDSGGGVGGEEADVVDGADVEDGSGEVEGVAVLAEGFEEGVGGVVVTLARVLNGCEEGAGEKEEV